MLDFASLHEQGKMLNRVAAFAEKAGLPHNRVLTDDELAELPSASGAIPSRRSISVTIMPRPRWRAFFALADS